jgi:hypothetical protein
LTTTSILADDTVSAVSRAVKDLRQRVAPCGRVVTGRRPATVLGAILWVVGYPIGDRIVILS